MLKIVGNSLMKNGGIYIVSVYLPLKSLLIVKGKLVTLEMEKPGRHHRQHVIQDNSTNSGTNGHYVAPDMMH